MGFKKNLESKIPKKVFQLVPRAFEIVGDIAIFELPENVRKYAKEIAEAVIHTHKNVRVVLLKTGDVKGTYRIPKYRVIYATERHFPNVPKWARPSRKLTETIHTENGCRFRIDLSRAYFTGKLSGERARIAHLVKPEERILVMFAGVGPFAIVTAKKKSVKVYAVEINPFAVKMLRDNIILNKEEDKVFSIEGDVAEVVPAFRTKFDRIMMPAPKDAHDFLEAALSKTKIGGYIHLYSFAGQEKVADFKSILEKRCVSAGYRCNVVRVGKCGAVGVRQYRIVADIRVVKKRKLG